MPPIVTANLKLSAGCWSALILIENLRRELSNLDV